MVLRAAVAKSAEPNVVGIPDDHYRYFVPHIPELLDCRRGAFVARWEMRYPVILRPKTVGVGFQGSVKPKGSWEMGGYVFYGALRLLCAKFPDPEECCFMVREWLSREQRDGIESGRMAALIGVSEWGDCNAITVAVVANINKP